jgi:serine/threonine-protein kinase
MSDTSRSADTLPRTLGRYERLAPLASGGMASVHLGRVRAHAGFERLVAIKCCHPHLRDDPEFVAMFLDEARLAARIHHPNVVPTLDVGEEGSALYLVMEYVEGERLSGLVKSAARAGEHVPLPIAVRILADALTGLDAAHRLRGPDGASLRLVHRDVSPQNVLVGVDGVTRIMDFGIAKAEARSTVTREGQIKGKLGYMAPEQLAAHTVSPRSDVFAAAVVLWEVLAGRRLFQGESQADTINRVLHLPVEPPSKHHADVPPELDRVVLAGLARDPEQRLASAAAFAEALERTGIAPASPRAVGAYVERMLAPVLSERRAVVRRALTGSAADATPSEPRREATATRLEAPPKTPKRGALALVLASPVLASLVLVSLVLVSIALATVGAAAWLARPALPSEQVALPEVAPERPSTASMTTAVASTPSMASPSTATAISAPTTSLPTSEPAPTEEAPTLDPPPAPRSEPRRHRPPRTRDPRHHAPTSI